MIYNSPYCTLEDIATQLALESAPAEGLIDVSARAVVDEQNTAIRNTFKMFIKDASAMINAEMGRVFVPYKHQYEISRSQRNEGIYAHELLLPSDLLAVEAVINGDGTTLSVGDYHLTGKPDYILSANWYKGISWKFKTPLDKVRINGTWGYVKNYENAYRIIEPSPVLDASTTTIPVSDVSWYNVFSHIRIGTELMLIVNIDSATSTLTVERGVNGFTAATHDNTEDIELFIVDQLVKKECRRLAVRAYQFRNSVTLTGGEQQRELRIGPVKLPYKRGY